MKTFLLFLSVTTIVAPVVCGEGSAVFTTDWIPSKPEVLTYKTTSPEGDGLYQVSINRRDSVVELYMNIISPGFTKTVAGSMTLGMLPLFSTAKLIVNDQVIMDTKCSYERDRLRVSTVMAPYSRTIADTIALTEPIIDFSQIPLAPRLLPLAEGVKHRFASLNPQTNRVVPLTLMVEGVGSVHQVDCYKVKMNTFEGQSIYWVEKGGHHRVMRVEQAESHRMMELLDK